MVTAMIHEYKENIHHKRTAATNETRHGSRKKSITKKDKTNHGEVC